jgi:hypothetical protein
MNPVPVWVVVAALVAALAMEISATPNRENAVGTYQIACAGSYSSQHCKIIDTRTGDVVGGE